jgi:hypothetical protein
MGISSDKLWAQDGVARSYRPDKTRQYSLKERIGSSPALTQLAGHTDSYAAQKVHESTVWTAMG